MACFDTLLCEQMNKYGHRFSSVVKDDSEITIMISAERVQRHSTVISKLEKPVQEHRGLGHQDEEEIISKVLVEILALLYVSAGHSFSCVALLK